MLTKLKEKVQRMLSVQARAAYNIGLTPNVVSLIGISLAFFSAVLYAEWQNNKFFLFLATIFFFLSGFCDVLDGIIARLYNETTRFGGFFDSLLDRYSDSFVYIGIILGELCNPLWGLIALIGSLLVSYTRARAEAIGIKMQSIGLAERAERMLIIIFVSLVAVFLQPKIVINFGIILLAVLTNITVIQRGFHVYNRTKKEMKR
jgi:archaetidylinositol phosphate synthase